MQERHTYGQVVLCTIMRIHDFVIYQFENLDDDDDIRKEIVLVDRYLLLLL